MNMKKNDKGKWEVRLSLGTDARGKRVQKYLSADTKQELRAKASAFEQAYANGEIASTVNERKTMRTISDLLDEYYEVHTPSLSINTRRNYQSLIACMKRHLGTHDINRLTARHLESYLSMLEKEKGMKTSSINLRIVLFRAAFDYAKQAGYTKNDAPMFLKRRKETKAKRNLWSVDELVRFLDTAREHSPYWITFVLLAMTGARRNEVKALTWDCVRIDEGYVHINKSIAQLTAAQKAEFRTDKLHHFTPPKTKRNRDIHLDPVTLSELQRWRIEQMELLLRFGEKPEDNLVCTTPFGKYLNDTLLRTEYRRICKQAELAPMRIHDFRHMHATILLNNDTNIKVIQERLGHTSIATTMNIYSHVTTEKQKDAANAFRLQIDREKKRNVQ